MRHWGSGQHGQKEIGLWTLYYDDIHLIVVQMMGEEKLFLWQLSSVR